MSKTITQAKRVHELEQQMGRALLRICTLESPLDSEERNRSSVTLVNPAYKDFIATVEENKKLVYENKGLNDQIKRLGKYLDDAADNIAILESTLKTNTSDQRE